MILLTNELSREHPGLNAGSIGTVVHLPRLGTQRSGATSSSVPAVPNELVLDQVHTPSTEQLQRARSLSRLLTCVP